MFYRRKSLLGGLVVAALIFGACQAGPSGAPSEPAGTGATPTDAPSVAPTDKRLVFASRETIDSAFAVETDDAFALHFMGVAETLARTSFDGLLEPALATAWERTGDLTWEFTLREGVTFQDGTPFDADAVAAALTYLLGVDAPARSFNPSTFTSVEAVGSNVVRVTSAQPNVLVPYYLASPSTVILAQKAYGGDQIDPIEAGTGPFVMTAMNLPESVALDRNPNYWGGSVALAGADIRIHSRGQHPRDAGPDG